MEHMIVRFRVAAVERIWNMEDNQGQILALALRKKAQKPFQLFPLRSEAVPSLHDAPPLQTAGLYAQFGAWGPLSGEEKTT